MSMLAMILALALAAVVALYFLAPRTLFNAARNAQRRKGGMVQKSIEADGLTWPYLEGGKADGEALVLVHGFGGDKDNWSFYAPCVKDHYRVIAPDLPGFGENTRAAGLDYSGAAQAERLAAFLDALGIETCHLGGNSMGGLIALHFALKYPQRLRSLTLFNNAGVIGPDESELQQMVGRGESPLVPRSLADVDKLMDFIVHKPRYIPGAFKKVMWQDMAPHQGLLDAIFAQIAEEALVKPLNARLGEVSVPTQIVWGRHDRLLDVSCATVQHEGIRDSELVVFEDVGHVPMIEKPAETARHHLAFLEKH